MDVTSWPAKGYRGLTTSGEEMMTPYDIAMAIGFSAFDRPWYSPPDSPPLNEPGRPATEDWFDI